MLVIEYTKKFENMVVYFEQVMYAPDEKLKVNRFMFELRSKITHSVSQREFTTYAKLLRQFYVVEDSLKWFKRKKISTGLLRKAKEDQVIILILSLNPSKESKGIMQDLSNPLSANYV